MTLQSCQYFIVTALKASPPLIPLSGLIVLLALSFKVLLSLYRTHQTKHQLLQAAIDTPETVTKICQQNSIAVETVTVIKHDQYLAASVGIIKPQIIISTQVINNLTSKELAAVLLHEAYHAQKLHPLIAISLQSLQKILFAFPIVEDLAEYISCSFESAADAYVITQQQTNQHLKKAMKVFLKEENKPSQLQLPAFAYKHVRSRLLALRGQTTPFNLSKSKLLKSILSGGLLVLVMLLSQTTNSQLATWQQAQAQTTKSLEQKCSLMSCATECMQQQNSTRQQSTVDASLNRQSRLELTE